METRLNTNVVKSVKPELRQALYIVMVPDEVDLHGDVTSAEEIAKACANFNEFCGKGNLGHVKMTNDFTIIESYIAPVDFVLDEVPVTKGTWLMNTRANTDELWALMKSGEFAGLSIAGWGKAEELGEV